MAVLARSKAELNAVAAEIRDAGRRAVALTCVVWLCQAAGRQMVAQRSGSIVNVDSIGSTHPSPMVSAYCAAKAGVVNLTQTLAQGWGEVGVRINALSPGLIDTKINQAMVEHPQIGPAIEQIVPLGRWGEVDDLAGAPVWLASDASAYVTGALIAYGAPATQATAAVIVYHAIAFWIPSLGGLAGYAKLRARQAGPGARSERRLPAPQVGLEPRPVCA